MWLDNKIFKEDLSYIVHTKSIDWGKFSDKTIFITGGTGLIGFYVINSILFYNKLYKADIRIIALVRDIEKAKKLFEKQLQEKCDLKFINGTIENLPEIAEHIDYIIHGASPTSSEFFLKKPVETIRISVNGTINILELAREKQINNMVFLSSMEIYGVISSDEKVDEEHTCNLSTMKARNSYPESKRLCENLCSGYYSEYNVPVNCLRLTQTFGPGITVEDQRIFAVFIRACLEDKDIVLFTEGKTCRSYLYLADAATAILTVLSSEIKNQAFNVANEETYCSIRYMADIVANCISQNNISVLVNKNEKEFVLQFMPELHMNLSTDKLKMLGWIPKFNLIEMFKRTIDSMNKKYR